MLNCVKIEGVVCVLFRVMARFVICSLECVKDVNLMWISVTGLRLFVWLTKNKLDADG